MTSNPQEWTVENIPESFWDPIEQAHCDLEAFRTIAMAMPREQLRELYDQYLAFANDLLTEEHLKQLGPDASEDAAMDVANWVVMQGSDFYFDVYLHPEKTPSRDQVRGRSFASIMVQVFADRFGEWI